MPKVPVPEFVWRTKGFLKLLCLEIYAFIARKDLETLVKRSDSFASRGEATIPAKASSTANDKKNTGAANGSKSNTNAGGSTASKSGANNRGLPATQPKRRPRPADK